MRGTCAGIGKVIDGKYSERQAVSSRHLFSSRGRRAAAQYSEKQKAAALTACEETQVCVTLWVAEKQV